MAPTIDVHGLTRSFGATVALADVDLDVDAGEVVALLGPNGAGKTTTIRILNGVLRPDAGHARVLGMNPATDGERVRRRTGVLTENSGLDDRLTALENVVTYARIRGIHPRDARRLGGELLERFGMAGRVDQPVQGMSTGQRKRAALARALIHDPEVLFLDEPTSGLDPAVTREVLDLLAALARDRGRAIVLCTHFLAEASRLCQRVAILEEGHVIAAGRPKDLARSLWPGLPVEVEFEASARGAGGQEAGTAIDGALEALRALHAVPGVTEASATSTGALLQVRDREVLPKVVAALVTREIAVYSVKPHRRTLEDVYFALTGRAQVDADDVTASGFEHHRRHHG